MNGIGAARIPCSTAGTRGASCKFMQVNMALPREEPG